jgi:hypothetical protein
VYLSTLSGQEVSHLIRDHKALPEGGVCVRTATRIELITTDKGNVYHTTGMGGGSKELTTSITRHCGRKARIF